MEDVLIAFWLIGLTCILPILAIWFSMRKKVNETNKRQEILMIVALSYGLVFSFSSVRRDIKEYR